MTEEQNDRPYRICTRCVMDTSDPDITFDANGVCNHCHTYDTVVRQVILPPEQARTKIATIVERIRTEGTGRPYDCIIGVSGGVDSSYLAYKVRDLGLRPLAVHLDNGWDSELAVANIHKVLERLGIDLYTHVIDWEEFRDLQLSFLKASTPDSEIPSDHAIVSLMGQMAAKNGIRHIIAGYNAKTESHLPAAWSQGHWDWRYIKSVQDRFGTVPLRTFPHMNLFGYARYILVQRWVLLLNYIDYNKAEAMKFLEDKLGWRYYGGKHYESIYTRFYQGYILPRKFGYDKRRTHYSSLICSGEITRDEVLKILEEPPYPADLMAEDKAYVVKKLGLTEAEFEAIMNLPKKTYWDYPSYGHFLKSPAFDAVKAVFRAVRKWD